MSTFDLLLMRAADSGFSPFVILYVDEDAAFQGIEALRLDPLFDESGASLLTH